MLEHHTLEFFRRTFEHIKKVQECALELAMSGLFNDMDIEILLKDAARHDASKFSDKERPAYTQYWHELTQIDRNNAKELKTAQYRKFQRAWKHHQANNAHHPEWWENKQYMMSNMALLEMVCDWAAVSREYQDDLHAWAEKMYDKWPQLTKFEELINKAVNVLEPKEEDESLGEENKESEKVQSKSHV